MGTLLRYSPSAMTHAQLLTLVDTLYGGNAAALARDLDINERTMRRWIAGTSPIPAIESDALTLLDKRIATLTNIAWVLRHS